LFFPDSSRAKAQNGQVEPTVLTRRFFSTLAIWVWLCCAEVTWGHGDLQLQIDALTAKLREHPDHVEWILKRAELRRLDGQFPAALRDCDRAEKLDRKSPLPDLVRGKVFADTGRLAESRSALDRFLKAEPRHGEALLVRARLFVRMKEFEAAAADFSSAITNSAAPEPDLYLKRAQAWQSASNNGNALAGLNEGITRFGPVVSLELPALEMEVAMGRFASALARVDLLAAQSQRKDIWLFKRGEILEHAGRIDEARAALTEAAAAMAQLPPARRDNETSRELNARIATAQKRLARN
jgi:tetratricopeptide (TPR) repeat protein